MSSVDWSPPYCARDTELACPKCGAEKSVCVREHEAYFDGGGPYEAYCAECHCDLEVQASVTIEFSDPEEVPE